MYKTRYELMEEEDWPSEIKKSMKGSYLYALGVFWKLYESIDGWFVRCQNINDIEHSLWLKVRVVGDKPYIVEDMCFDFYCSDIEGENLFELLYKTQRWHKWICGMFLGGNFEDDKLDYDKWILHDDVLINKLEKGYLYVGAEPREKAYIDIENMSKELEEITSKAYMGMIGFFWELHEIENVWYIRVQSICDLGKELWIKVRVINNDDVKNIELTSDNLVLDYQKGNMSNEEKYKVLYLTEVNKSLLSSVLLSKYSSDSEEQSHYKKWVIQGTV